jgi:predicted RNA methylase
LLDPARGQGAFYNALLKVPGARVDWCEIAEGRDFLDYTKKVDWIVTNPPWSNGPFRHFLNHAFDLADNVVFLIKTQMARSTVARIRSERLAGFGQKEWVMMGWHDAFDIPGYNSGLAVAAVHWQKGYVGPIAQTDWTAPLLIAA